MPDSVGLVGGPGGSAGTGVGRLRLLEGHHGFNFQPSTKPIPNAQSAKLTGSSLAYCLRRSTV